MRVPLAALAALLAAAGCSSEPAPRGDAQQARAAPAAAMPLENASDSVIPASAPAPEPPPAAAAAAMAAKGVRRCGWLSNPTPANWWLTDSEQEWVLGTQGGYQAPGMDEMPDMTTAGWVETNGYYGYGCACMTIASDAGGKVTRISDAQPKPLKQCRADRKLPKPD